MNFTKFNQTEDCNFSALACSQSSASNSVYVLLYMVMGLIALMTVCGNLLVIISVCHFKQLHTPTNVLILSLASTDFLVGVTVIPLHFIFMIESCWVFGSVFCKVYIVIACLFTNLSVSNIVSIAADRFIALSNPFLYEKKVSVSVMVVVAVFCWVVSWFYSCSFLILSGTLAKSQICDRSCIYIVDGKWYFADILLVFILPCSTIIGLYVQVFTIARKHAGAIRQAQRQKHTQGQKNSKRSEGKAAKVLGILVFVFILCLMPFHVYGLVSFAHNNQSVLLGYLVTIFYLNSSINPMIYALFYPCFQESMKLILTLKIFQRDSSFIDVLARSS